MADFGIPSGGVGDTSFSQWYQNVSNQMMQQDQSRRRKTQQLFDQIGFYENEAKKFTKGQLPVDLFQNLRRSINEYEQLSGEQYAGAGRELIRLAPFRPPAKISLSFKKSEPSAVTQVRRAERAAIKTKKEAERQEIRDVRWLS